MNKNICGFFLGCMIVFLSVPGWAQKYETSDGKEFSVNVRPEKEVLMFGETTFLIFEVKNHSKNDLYFGDGGDYRNNIGRPERYRVKVVREDGKPVPQPNVTISTGGLIGGQTVPAGGSYIRRLFLPHWATFEGTGTYEISVERSLEIRAKADTPEELRGGKRGFRSIATTARTKLSIVETDKDKLGALITELGDRLISETDGSAARDLFLLLQFINDDRTIKYWIEVLRIYSSSSDREAADKYGETPLVLARYNTPESMAALEDATKSQNEDVRLDVADALRISSNPRAIKLLMSMRGDSYWLVRLRVAQALDKITTDESTEILIGMLTDNNKSVWESAENSLKARGKMPNEVPLLDLSV